MSKLFGTDGIRGVVGSELDPGLAFKVGYAAATLLAEAKSSPVVLVCRDTRSSGPSLEEALVEGMVRAGVQALRCGILPTPAVAFLVAQQGADAGAVISASHNPPEYNGIKFFGASGHKLIGSMESEIEARLDREAPFVAGGAAGSLASAEDRYVAHALRALDGRTLSGMKVVVDCGFGASYRTSPRALREAGAQVIALNEVADGDRINVGCGSTHPEMMAKAVLEHSAGAGIAHDGDADRVIAVDELGNMVDGDAMLAIAAIELKEQGKLSDDLVVSTVMSNLGFRKAMDNEGITVVETPVGDRYVADALQEHRAVLGGEQSGHLIFTEYSTTGDGLITALRLLGRMVSTGRSLSDLAGVVEKYPQVLVNVAVPGPGRVESSSVVKAAVTSAQARLKDSGRVLVRASGTEPLVRVMVEAEHEFIAREVADQIARSVIEELGDT